MSSTETAVTTTAKTESATKPVMFTFGEPESVVGACDFEAYMLGEELTPARKPAAVA